MNAEERERLRMVLDVQDGVIYVHIATIKSTTASERSASLFFQVIEWFLVLE